MKSVLVRNNRRVLAGLLVCTGFICNYPSSAFAESDNSSVQITTQSTTPQKRTLVGTVVDSSTGETLIGVNVKVQGEDGGTITDNQQNRADILLYRLQNTDTDGR